VWGWKINVGQLISEMCAEGKCLDLEGIQGMLPPGNVLDFNTLTPQSYLKALLGSCAVNLKDLIIFGKTAETNMDPHSQGLKKLPSGHPNK